MIPQVSFAIFMFNQERFIADAVHAALSQDFDGQFEVIISDDGSSDRTWEVAQQAVESYTGELPDIVWNRRVGGNGLVDHFLDVARRARGELLVVAAGDDISTVDRISRLYAEWRRKPCVAICSSYTLMSEGGPEAEMGDQVKPRALFDSGEDHVIHIPGCTAAYSREFIRSIGRPDQKVWLEDYFYSLIAARRSLPIRVVERSLVNYRIHSTSISTLPMHADRRLFEEKSIKMWQLQARTLEIVTALDGPDIGDGSSECFKRELMRTRFLSDWPRADFRQRLNFAREFPHHRRWMLPRLFGLPFFLFAARLVDKIRQWFGTDSPTFIAAK